MERRSKRALRAFTLVEMLVVVGIIAALMVTVIPMVSKYIKDGKNDYNEKLKSQLLLSGKDYYSNNKDKLPVKVGLKYKKIRIMMLFLYQKCKVRIM